MAVVLAFSSLAAGLERAELLAVAAAEEAPAPAEPDDAVPAPPPVRVVRGDPVPASLKRQAEVMRAALQTVMPTGELYCQKRVHESSTADCTFDGGSLYDWTRRCRGRTAPGDAADERLGTRGRSDAGRLPAAIVFRLG